MVQLLTILIIDDSSEDREAYRRYLLQDQEYNYNILESASGEKALEIYRQFPTDCILLDFLLPDMDGLEFLAELLKLAKPVPAVVMLTGYGNEAIAVQAMKSGVHDYLVKGQTTAGRLHSTIHSAVAQVKLRQELQQSEARLRESQQFIERIAETTPGILYVYDLLEQRNLYLNGQVNRLLGYTSQQIKDLGQEFLVQTMYPDDLPLFFLHLQKIATIQNNEILEFEYRMRHANGQWCWFYSRDTVFTRNADGSPRQIVGTAYDITTRKHHEVALQKSETKFRRIVESNVIGIYFADFSGLIYEANDAFLELLDYSRAELIAGNLRWDALTPLEYHSLDQQKVEELKISGVCTPFEKEYFRKDGQRVSVLVGIARIDDTDHRGYSVCFVLDLTERKLVEAERQRLLQLEQAARAEAEAANRAKDEFVAMVSHDLRSPLNAILGWTQLLRTRNMSPENINHALETIERNAQSQAKLLEDLLNMSRILRGKLQLELRQVYLVAIVSQSIQAAYPSAQAKNIHIESVIDQSISTITGDGDRLLQVFGNLLSNAIKFTPNGGRIDVKLLRQESHIEIAVSDTGIGISSEFLPYIFERYRQDEQTPKQGGLGLGLAIARYLIELHGGTIQAISLGAGQGSTFSIKLPLP
ncbi:PAS domain S-box protein [Nostoc sp. FACHB-87]|uniref:hybrid sensor histidine kinase/response regulator n=1 Tax=Nostocaceae TaxID=1162 RepID=UPI0016885ADF|nr:MULTISPECIES: ATP-binding protein [Nostocaceae]MBD2454802.1 PAS domain S-box protein [Nostoc sp. FACHB-87]MBD2476740.1 PAS domain S-box protein [Anabaena sp. FACHB-83]